MTKSSSDAKQQISLEVPYRETISRLFIFRGLWVFVIMWIMWVWSIWVGILMFLQFWYQLITGKRHEFFWKSYKRFFKWMTRWQAYLTWMVDERPGFIE